MRIRGIRGETEGKDVGEKQEGRSTEKYTGRTSDMGRKREVWGERYEERERYGGGKRGVRRGEGDIRRRGARREKSVGERDEKSFGLPHSWGCASYSLSAC